MPDGASISAHVQKIWVLWSSLGNWTLLWTYSFLLTSFCTPCHWVLVVNYNMIGVNMSLNELHFMIFMAETSIRRVPDVLVVTGHSKKVKKAKWKGNRTAKDKSNAQTGSKSTPKPLKVSMPTSNTVWFQYNDKNYYNINTKWLKTLIRISRGIVAYVI
jgi:hypothetical protein